MLSDNSLNDDEKNVIDVLLSPYGVEMTSSAILQKAGSVLTSSGMLEALDSLLLRGYVKTRSVLLPGHLVKRNLYALDHSRVHKQSTARLQTRLIIERMMVAGMCITRTKL